MKRTFKQLTAVLLTVSLLISSIMVFSVDTPLIGDVNGDKLINAKDIIITKMYINGDIQIDTSLADTNLDGLIDGVDLLGISALVAAFKHICSTFTDGVCDICGRVPTPTDGLEYKLSSDGTEYAVSGIGEAKDMNIVIPSTYNDRPVTSVYEYAFYGDDITSVIIPDSVTKIGDAAFCNCSALTSVKIGSGVTTIADQAFYGCGLTGELMIPDNVTKIGNSAFYNCVGLTSLTIGDSVGSIGNRAFYGCTGLTELTVGTSLAQLGNEVFYDCSGLMNISVNEDNTVYHSAGDCLIETASKTLILGGNNSVIPDDGSVTAIGEYAFTNCVGLVGDLIIPQGITSIGRCAFWRCVGLTSVALNNVETIEESAFWHCEGLTGALTIPDSVITIGERAFSFCGVSSAVIGDGVSKIGAYAFSDCGNLVYVTIGESVVTMSNAVFSDCDNLSSVVFDNTSGWYVTNRPLAESGTNVDVSDPLLNAESLKRTYVSHYWRRSVQEQS